MPIPEQHKAERTAIIIFAIGANIGDYAERCLICDVRDFEKEDLRKEKGNRLFCSKSIKKLK